MKAITLRNLPSEVERLVRRRAAERGQSLNRTVIELVEEGAGLAKPRRAPRNSDFDEFVARWSKEDSKAFEGSLRDLRKVDAEVWR